MADGQIEYISQPTDTNGNNSSGDLSRDSKNKLKWVWSFFIDNSFEPESNKCKQYAFLSWKFEWDELEKQGIIGFEGDITANYYHSSHEYYVPVTFKVKLSHSGQTIEKRIATDENTKYNGTRYFKFQFKLNPIRLPTEVKKLNEANSNLNDVILLVEGTKIHTNKNLLSCHSRFFYTMFNSEFKEKSMDEIPIEGVSYLDFSDFLDIFHPDQVFPTEDNAEALLELADRFLAPSVRRHVELLMIPKFGMTRMMVLAANYGMKDLWNKCLEMDGNRESLKRVFKSEMYSTLSDAHKINLLEKLSSFV